MSKPNGKEELGVTSLCRKRQELIAEIGEKEIALQNLLLQLNHIDAALNILRPEIALTALPASHVTPRRAHKRGDIARPILAAMHQATAPVTVKELARAYLIAHGKPAQRISEAARETVRRKLRHMKGQGLVRSAGSEGPAQTWELVRD